MKTSSFTITRPDTGAVLPLAKVTVYLANGTTKASIFNSSGGAISNPVTADTNGSFSIQAVDGTYVLSAVSADGSYTVPPITVDLYDLGGLQAACALSAAQAATSAIAAQGYVGTLPTSVVSGGTLPKEVTAISGGIGTGTGGTPGTYDLGVTGGPAGFKATVTIGAGGSIASYQILNNGISTSATAPTLSLAGVTGLTGATTPTATVGTIPVNRLFAAPDSTFLYKQYWINNAGTLTQFPLTGTQFAEYFKAGIDATVPQLYETTVAYVGLLVLDAGGRLLGQVPDPAVALLVATAATAAIYETTDNGATAYILDAGGRIVTTLGGSGSTGTELIAARGSRASLDNRLSQSLDAYGSPLDSFNANRMRRYHYKARKRLLGEAVRLPIGLWGDSFTFNTSRWSGDFAATIIAAYGDGGGGWAGFGFNAASGTWVHGGTQPANLNGNVRATYGVSLAGTWDQSYAIVPSPDTCCAISSTAFAEIRATFPASPILSGADLFWIGTADGVMRYSWDNASWTTLNVQGSVGDCSFASLANVPTSGPGTLYLQVVSGTCKPAGINWKSAASGVVVHKLAATGSKLSQLATQAAIASWKSAVAALGLDCGFVMHGTNDQGSSNPPSQFAADATTVLGALQTAIAGIDRLFLMPPENQRTGMAYPMTAYKAAVAPVAANLGISFVDLQRNFGDPANPTEYGSAGATPLFNADNIHPEPTTGGRAIVDAVLRFLAAA